MQAPFPLVWTFFLLVWDFSPLEWTPFYVLAGSLLDLNPLGWLPKREKKVLHDEMSPWMVDMSWG